MRLMNLVAGKEINYEIDFISPWKSHSKVCFQFEQLSDSVKVTWNMQGSVPVFLFFIRKLMSAWVGSDYDRGLLMLKEFVEKGEVITKSELTGEVEKPGFYFLGKRQSSAISDMPQLMEADFKELRELIERGKVAKPDRVLSFYHKFDLVKGVCEFTSALAYEREPLDEGHGLSAGKVPAHKCTQAIHTGPYRHIGNAWSTVMGHQRMEKLKANKKVPWYELYLNSPLEVSENELKTEINIPIR